MLLGFLLFEGQFVHVVAITFTSLILNELLLVALTIRSWHGLMLLAELSSILIYIVSLLVLKDYFGKNTHVIHSNTHITHSSEQVKPTIYLVLCIAKSSIYSVH